MTRTARPLPKRPKLPKRPWHALALEAMLAACLGLASVASLAGEHGDHDRARAALAAKEILPLPVVLGKVAKSHPGEVLEVELEREDRQWVYEFKLLQPGGALLKLEVDARTGEVIKRKDVRR